MTKTINEFVNEFNEKYGEIGDVGKPLKVEETNHQMTLSLGYTKIIDLYDDGCWDIKEYLGAIKPIYQKSIMDYVYNSEPKDWFGDDDDDEIVVDGIKMTKAQADQLYDYFTIKQNDEIKKQDERLKEHFSNVCSIWNM